jgi:hypothetical protein
MSHPPRPQSEKLVLYIPANVYGSKSLQKPYAKTDLDESCACIDVS